MSGFEDFRGDFEQLAEMMEISWRENVMPSPLYTADFVAGCFEYPGSSFSLAPAIYHEGQLVGFVAGFPRRIQIQGEERHVLVVAFLTVASEQKNSGYGVLLWSELIRRAMAAGFDGVVNYCVEGEAMNRMIEGSCRRLRLPVLRAFSFSYLSRMLWTRRTRAPEPGPSVPAENLTIAAARVPERVPLARLWSADEAAWQLNRANAVCATSGPSSDPAVLTGYTLPVAKRDGAKCLVVEDVLWGGLGTEAKTALVGEFVARGAANGARLAILPMLAYADTEPFLAAGFRASATTIHAYLTLWTGPMPDSPVSSYYLDVF